MPTQYDNALDGFRLQEQVESFGGGMDGFQRATLLAPDVSQYLQNIILLDNLEARTRPGADRLGTGDTNTYLTGEDGQPILTAGGERILLTAGSRMIGPCRGLFYYDTLTVEQLIATAGTEFWTWNGIDWTKQPGFNATDADVRVEMAQGVDKVLISDGVKNLQMWDGTTFTDLGSLANTIIADPPVGAKVLCWHGGRMMASGVGAYNDTIWASPLLSFGRGVWDHLHFSWRVGGGDGDPIVALGSLQDFNLLVMKENSVWLSTTNPEAANATEWPARKLVTGSGIAGKHAFAVSDNDAYVMIRGVGVQLVSRMEAAAGQYDISPPISTPLQPYIDRINWTRGDLIEGKSFKHLVFFSVPLDSSQYNNFVLVFNRRLNRWVGVWTGWTPLCWEVTRFAGVQRLVFGEQTGLVREWKDTADVNDDATYTEDGAAIETKAWLRAFQFGEKSNDKTARDCEARFSAANALVQFTLVLDNVEVLTWSKDMRTEGPALPVDLPFDLGSPGTVPARRGLRGLSRFNEGYIRVESTAGWWSMRKFSMTGYSKRMPTHQPATATTGTGVLA